MKQVVPSFVFLIPRSLSPIIISYFLTCLFSFSLLVFVPFIIPFFPWLIYLSVLPLSSFLCISSPSYFLSLFLIVALYFPFPPKRIISQPSLYPPSLLSLHSLFSFLLCLFVSSFSFSSTNHNFLSSSYFSVSPLFLFFPSSVSSLFDLLFLSHLQSQDRRVTNSLPQSQRSRLVGKIITQLFLKVDWITSSFTPRSRRFVIRKFVVCVKSVWFRLPPWSLKK